MNCHEFDQLLMSRLDGSTVPLPPAVQAHLKDCSRCRELLILGDRLRAIPVATPGGPGPGFSDRVVLAVQVERRRRTFRRWAVGLSAAAAALLAIFAWQGLNWPANPNLPLAHKPSEPRPDVPPPSLQQARDLGQASIERTRLLAEDAAKQASVLLASTEDLMPAQLNMAPTPVPDVGKSVSEGLEPVTKSTRRAFDAWLNLLPRGGDEKPGL